MDVLNVDSPNSALHSQKSSPRHRVGNLRPWGPSASFGVTCLGWDLWVAIVFAPCSCPILWLELACCRGRRDLHTPGGEGSLHGILQRPKGLQKGDSAPPCPVRCVPRNCSTALCWCQQGRQSQSGFQLLLKGSPLIQGSPCRERGRRQGQDRMPVQTRLWPQLLHRIHGALRCPLRKAQPSEFMP